MPESTRYGAQFVKKGFARDAEGDLAFALGFPLLREISDEEPEPPASADEALRFRSQLYRRVWPRKLATRLVRAWAKAKDVAEGEEAISPKDLERMVERLARSGAAGAFDTNEDAMMLLEALVGAERLTTAYVAALERLSDAEWSGGAHIVFATTFSMGLALLRVETKVAGALLERLETLYAKRETDTASWNTKALDVILHGAEGARRSGPRIGGAGLNARFCTLVHDDPALVLEVLEPSTDCGRWLPRLAFLGGPQAVTLVATRWRKGDGAAQRHFVETAGLIRAAAIDDAIAEMATSSKAKKVAEAWRASRGAGGPAKAASPAKPASRDEPASVRAPKLQWRDGDEFGYLVMSADLAKKWSEDDYDGLADAIDTETPAVFVHRFKGKKAIAAGLYTSFAWGEMEDGGVFVAANGSAREKAEKLCAALDTLDWVPLCEVVVGKGGIVGFDPRSSDDCEGARFEAALAPGTYEAKMHVPDDVAATLVRLRRAG